MKKKLTGELFRCVQNAAGIALSLCLAAGTAGCGTAQQGAETQESGFRDNAAETQESGFQDNAAETQESGFQDNAETQESGFRSDVPTAELQEAVAEELGEAYWPDTDIPAEILGETYGVTEDLYEEVSARMPMISVNVDTLIIVKAKEGSEHQIEDALNAYREYNAKEAMQYPVNMGKVQAAQVKAFGRYVCFVQLGADMDGLADEGTEEGDAAAIKHCEQVNAKALSVIEELLVR